MLKVLRASKLSNLLKSKEKQEDPDSPECQVSLTKILTTTSESDRTMIRVTNNYESATEVNVPI